MIIASFAVVYLFAGLVNGMISLEHISSDLIKNLTQMIGSADPFFLMLIQVSFLVLSALFWPLVNFKEST